MSANTPTPKTPSDYANSDAGGAAPWTTGALIAIALLMMMLVAGHPRQGTLSEAMGPPVQTDSL